MGQVIIFFMLNNFLRISHSVLMTTWELYRNWDVVRYLVYYLVEDLVPPEFISGKDVIDFSSGLGDLSAYIAENSRVHLLLHHQ